MNGAMPPPRALEEIPRVETYQGSRHYRHEFALALRPRVYGAREIRAWIRNSGAASRRLHKGLSAEIPATRRPRRLGMGRLTPAARLSIPKEPGDSGVYVREGTRSCCGIHCCRGSSRRKSQELPGFTC